MRLGKGVFYLSTFIGLLFWSLWSCPAAIGVEHSFVEDFSTTDHKDGTNTTAWWDTGTGELKLWPFHVSRAGQCYFSGDVSRSVAVDGDYAYVADGEGGLRVVNISDPSSPTLAGSRDTPGIAYDVAVAGDFAFVADGTNGLVSVNIGNPSNPFIAATRNTPGTAYGVALSGDYAYVADNDSVQVIDISAPANYTVFRMVGSAPLAGGNAIDLCVVGNYLYVAAFGGGLQVFDITSATAPVWVATYATPDYAYEVTVVGDMAYVAVYESGVEVVDVSDPTSPAYEGSLDTPGQATAVSVSGDWLYVGDNVSGVQVLDITNPAAPAWVDSCQTAGSARKIVIEGGYAFVAATVAGLEVLSISELIPPLFVNSHDTPGNSMCVVVDGDYAFVADQGQGLRIVDASDLAAISELGSYSRPYANGIAVEGDYAYIADVNNFRMWVVDVSDVTSPDSVGYVSTGLVGPEAVAVSGDYAYLATGTLGMQVVDISDPTSPSLVATFNTPGVAKGVTISGDLAMVADGSAGLRVVDISDPENPSSAGVLDTPGYAFQVAMLGDYACVADGAPGVHIIDTDSLFMAPRLVATCDTPDLARGLTRVGNYIFVAGASAGLHVLDVTDPATPTLVWSHDTPGTATGVAVSGDHAFVADYASGIQVIQVFQRDFNTQDNKGQSLVVATPPDTIYAVRVLATQADSVVWFVSADGGEAYMHVPLDGEWHPLISPGKELRWRSNHYYRQYGTNPACTVVEIQYRYNYAEIDSVKDVAEDQGGWLRIRFNASGLDFFEVPQGAPPGDYDVEQDEERTSSYGVYRRIDDIGFAEELLREGTRLKESTPLQVTSGDGAMELPATLGGAVGYSYEGRYFYVPETYETQGFPPGLWEVVGTVPALREAVYYCLVPSVGDSMSTFRHTVFCITTHTVNPDVFYFSPPDSGYSVDNLPPAAPEGAKGDYGYPPPSLLVTWEKSPERDFSHYAVYKGFSPDFTPNPDNRLGTPWDSFLVDEDFDPDIDTYYKISAWDIHENESGFALLGPEDITLVENPPVPPSVTALEQNRPNPFNPATTIAFSVARPGPVSLRVYDVRGRCVRTLVDGVMWADFYEVGWDGRDDSGVLLPSGVYVYKLVAPLHVEARKMVLAR